jgi:hypothetical protein
VVGTETPIVIAQRILVDEKTRAIRASGGGLIKYRAPHVAMVVKCRNRAAVHGVIAAPARIDGIRQIVR